MNKRRCSLYYNNPYLYFISVFANQIFASSPTYVHQLSVVVTSCLSAEPHAGAPELDSEFLLNLVWGIAAIAHVPHDLWFWSLSVECDLHEIYRNIFNDSPDKKIVTWYRSRIFVISTTFIWNQFIVCNQGLQVQITGKKDNWKSCSILEDNIKMSLEKINFECTDQALHANELSTFIKRGYFLGYLT